MGVESVTGSGIGSHTSPGRTPGRCQILFGPLPTGSVSAAQTALGRADRVRGMTGVRPSGCPRIAGRPRGARSSPVSDDHGIATYVGFRTPLIGVGKFNLRPQLNSVWTRGNVWKNKTPRVGL